MRAGSDPFGVIGPACPADTGLVASALTQAAGLGDYFTIALGTATGAWRPAAVAYRNGMSDLIDHTARRLGTSQRRVAVSITQLGYAARLWSPGLATALQQGIVPALHDLQIRMALPVLLGLPRSHGWHADEPRVRAGLLYQTVVQEHLEPLIAGLDPKLASGLLWGNAASAMTGALGVIVRASPGLAGPARDLADLLLSTGRLSGTGRLARSGLDFRRRSCCLYYRVPGGGICGDCSLAAEPGS